MRKFQTEHSTEAERVLSEQRMFHERDADLSGVDTVNTWHAKPDQQMRTDRGTFLIRVKSSMRLTPERMANARVPAPDEEDDE